VNITGLAWTGTPALSDITAQQGGEALTPSYVDYAGGMLSVAFDQSLAAGTQVTMQIGTLDGNAALQGAQLGAVSCTSASDCTAIGELGQESVTAPQVLAVTERHGSWGTLSVLPGTTGYHAINGDLADTMVTSLSCTAPGQCVMTGYHASDSYGEYDNIDQARPFIATQVNGAWQAARALPGLAALNRGGVADIASASCASPGNCAVTGFYTLAGCNAQVCYERPFVAAEIRGAWSLAQPVPGLAVQITGINAGAFISCSRAAGCVAVGSYKGRGGFPPTRLWATFRG
jgi:hypothetical protein